ncbi:MAG: hypothetical protein VST68_03350 [Nitrospirota bacterium]|nr:hypothetical protein [Nitrospirota bacterium]
MDINSRLQINTPFITTGVKDRDPGKNYYFNSQQKRSHPHPNDEKGTQDNGLDEPEHLIDVMA